MALSEAEELEMLELENENALAMRDSVASQPQAQGPMSELPPVAGAMMGAAASLPFSPMAGPFAPLVPVAGAAIGAMGARGFQIAGRQLGQIGRGEQPISSGEAASDIARTGLVQGAGEMLGPIGGKGLQQAGKMLVPVGRTAAKVGGQVIRAATGVPENAASAVLRDPDILSRALPVEEAGKVYSEAVGGRGGAEASRQMFGKSYLSAEQAADAFDEIRPAIQAKSLMVDDALTLRQRTMKSLNDTGRDKPELRRLLSQNVQELDSYIEEFLPEWSTAKQTYREAKIGEEFGSFLPLNKNLSPNVLRSWAGIASMGKGIAEGNPLFLGAGLAVSPKAWGTAIKATYAGSRIIPTAALTGAKIAAQSLADNYKNAENR